VTSRVQGRTRSVLVIGEVGLALMLVVSTGLMLHSFRSLLSAETGFRREHVLSMQLGLPEQRYPLKEQRVEFYLRLEEKLRALPGVEAVGLVDVLPMDWSDSATRLTHAARPNAAESEMPVVRLRTVSDDYFRTLQIPLLRGRHFDARDHLSGKQVAIVSERLAQQLWPGLDPLGKQVRLIGEREWIGVIGVVADSRHNPNLGPALQPTLHLPMRQAGAPSTAIVLRTTGSATALAPAAQRAIATLDPALAAGDVRTLERVIHNALAPQRTTAGMLGAFGFVALVLACVGVYGVVSYSMARRSGELGLRVALGARQTDVIRLVLRHGATLTGAGVLLGLAGTWILARVMRGLMFAAEPPSALTFIVGVLLLTGTALLACFQPARRAASADPTTLLRRE
jgi:putative ABC transport system permease protein